MNYGDIQEDIFRWLGYPEASQRPNYLRQEVKDRINDALDRIKKQTHSWWYDVRVSSVAIVAGTTTYELDQFCLMPVGFWTADTSAHEVVLTNLKDADRTGLRSTSVMSGAYGPYTYTWYPRRHTASLSGTGGINDNSTTFTRTAGDTFATTDVSKRIQINGEGEEYTIASRTSANVVELDRTYRSRVSGTGASSPNMSGVPFKVSPGPVWQIEVLPVPQAAQTLYYRYIRRWTRMVNAYEVPSLEEDWHWLLCIGAREKLARYLKEDPGSYAQQFYAGMERMRALDKPEGEPGFVSYTAPIQNMGLRIPYPPDVNWRGQS